MKKLMILSSIAMIAMSGAAFGYDVVIKNASNKDGASKTDLTITSQATCRIRHRSATLTGKENISYEDKSCGLTNAVISAGSMGYVAADVGQEAGGLSIKDDTTLTITYSFTKNGKTINITQPIPAKKGGLCLYFDGTPVVGSEVNPGGPFYLHGDLWFREGAGHVYTTCSLYNGNPTTITEAMRTW